MFGYVNINKAELKMKDFYKYKAYYCGLCKTLKDRYGRFGQLTLSYDMTFLIILLTSLYESDTKQESKRCMVHPAKKHSILRNNITEYVADMNIVLTYHHLKDDWQDDKSLVGLAGSRVLKGAYKKISKSYPRQCDQIRKSLNRLKELEEEFKLNKKTRNEAADILDKELELDSVARCFGELMAVLFVYKEDVWKNSLEKIGFYLGKYIYILDAYDDLQRDMKNGSYNPLIMVQADKSFEANIEEYLTMMMAECTEEFEKLPCLLDVDILRNILYSGVWTKYEKISKERNTAYIGKD